MSSEEVVQGEAIESEDDSDIEFERKEATQAGTVFSGEAPESDDEIYAFSNVKLGTAKEATETYRPSPVQAPHKPARTLLQKMLIDRNHMLWDHLNQCVQSTVVTASSQIIAAEQLLIQSQIKLQAATQLIKQANETADHVLTKCNDVLTADFLPDIKTID